MCERPKFVYQSGTIATSTKGLYILEMYIWAPSMCWNISSTTIALLLSFDSMFRPLSSVRYSTGSDKPTIYSHLVLF